MNAGPRPCISIERALRPRHTMRLLSDAWSTMTTRRRLRALVRPDSAILVIALTFACGDRGRPAQMSAPEVPIVEGVEGRGVDAPVVIVTIDGVRWHEVFVGTDPQLSTRPVIPAAELVPTLHKIGTERGALLGAPGFGEIAASGPNFISLPGYTEILLGRPSTSCQRNDCERTTLPTVLDEARASGAKVAAFASWAPLDAAITAVPSAFVVSCGQDPSAGPRDPFPGEDDYRPDRVTANAALDYFERERPDVFFLGLGDPDEHAHRGDYEGYIASLAHADRVLGRLYAILDRMGERGDQTHVFVTADHGREAAFRHHGGAPESARVWLAVGGPSVRTHGFVRSPRVRHLADIAPTIRQILGLPPDGSTSAGAPLDELFSTPEAPPQSGS